MTWSNILTEVDLTQVVIINSAILVFSMVMCINSIVKFVQYMVQLSRMFSHETVIVRSIGLSKSNQTLFEYTSWLFVMEISRLKYTMEFHHSSTIV